MENEQENQQPRATKQQKKIPLTKIVKYIQEKKKLKCEGKIDELTLKDIKLKKHNYLFK